MIAVYACWYSRRGEIAGHELQECHLRRCILHCHSVGLELEVCIAADVEAIVCIREEGFGGVG